MVWVKYTFKSVLPAFSTQKSANMLTEHDQSNWDLC